MINTENDAHFIPETTIRPLHHLAKEPVQVRWTDTPHGFLSEDDLSLLAGWLRSESR